VQKIVHPFYTTGYDRVHRQMLITNNHPNMAHTGKSYWWTLSNSENKHTKEELFKFWSAFYILYLFDDCFLE